MFRVQDFTVERKLITDNEIYEDIKNTTKKVDVHVMVKDVKKYVDKYLFF